VLYGCNVTSWSHPRKQVRRALDDAVAARLKVIPAAPRAHRWGRVECPVCGNHVSVWSTPKSAAIMPRTSDDSSSGTSTETPSTGCRLVPMPSF